MSDNHLDEKRFDTDLGTIAYWVTKERLPDRPWLVFLPGLTADHRLFEKQIEHFKGAFNLLVWDAPSHGRSRPFEPSWTLDDKARWMKGILDAECVSAPILIGQSMGGYVAQAFMDMFPNAAKGFASIDSAPLQRSYYKAWELWFLKHTKTMFSMFPWNMLVDLGSKGNSTSTYGQELMRKMMQDYEKHEYCELSALGFKALAEAVEKDRPNVPDRAMLLICGEKDGAGSSKRYNREWSRRTGHPMHWIEGAGHNSNTDDPDSVNELIEGFIESIS